MRSLFLEEPELEFGGGGRHIDIRHGLANHGPLDRGNPSAPKLVRVGVVGAQRDVEYFRMWLERCRSGVPAKQSPRPTLFVSFPGFGENGALCEFACDERLVNHISARELEQLTTMDASKFGIAVSARFEVGASLLAENSNADVVVCLLPEGIVRRIDAPIIPERGPRSRRPTRSDDEHVWHDVFKARALHLRRPVQVIRPATYGAGVWGFRRDGKPLVALQDEATRAWNFFVGLYYKAGGVPWRLVRDATELTTCYAGISFYHDPASATMQTSVAQIFNERGEGMIVRGGPAQIDEQDKTPHLSATDARSLVAAAVGEYRHEHRTPPARLVCHKSSYFNSDEVSGCKAAATATDLDTVDLVSLRKSRTRLYRAGANPPLRGTAVLHADGCLLYTQGSVDFYRCYPGLYAPSTLDVQFDDIASGKRKLLEEILALTKMNWNSTGLVNLEPITLAAARSVGGILRHAGPSTLGQSRFSYFM